jgi:S-adenosylmethionine:tRNA ribosyltransferase-isomerase
MRLEDFDFDLPPGLIADRPAVPRDASRLLHVLPERLEDRRFLDLPDLLEPGDLLIFNDTKVIPARLVGRRGSAAIEATLHLRMAGDRWRAFARPARRLKPGDRIHFAPDFSAEVTGKGEGGEVELRFDRSGAELTAALERYGSMPLPPYIKRPGGADPRDCADYQTLFARIEGAVAAPTAGLHFTPRVLDALKARGVETAAVTLHVGAGTFLPVKA